MDPSINANTVNYSVDDDDTLDVLQLVLNDDDAYTWLLSHELVGQSDPAPNSNDAGVPDLMMMSMSLNPDVYPYRCPSSTPVHSVNMSCEASDCEEFGPCSRSTSACASGSGCASAFSGSVSASRNMTCIMPPSQTQAQTQVQTVFQRLNQSQLYGRTPQDGKQARSRIRTRGQPQQQPMDPMTRAAVLAYYTQITKMPNAASTVTSTATTDTQMRCDLCHGIYRRKFDLCRHVRESHLVQRDHECRVCFRTFKRVEHRNKHLALKHNIVIE